MDEDEDVVFYNIINRLIYKNWFHILAIIYIFLMMPITWPFVIAFCWGRKCTKNHTIIVMCFGIILIFLPLWIVLSPIGIPLSFISMIW